MLSPVGGWFVGRFGLVPTLRGLFLFGFVVLLAKFILLYVYSHETDRGLQRLEETRDRSLFSLLAEYRTVFSEILRSPAILTAMAFKVITSIFMTVNGSFWSVLFTTRLGFLDSEISLYVALRSVLMTLGFFFLGPRLTNLRRFRLPLWLGFGFSFLSQGILVLMPPRLVPLMVLSVTLDAFGAALVYPMTESLMASALQVKERARISAMVFVALILCTSPFGWIAGQLSALDRTLPFMLNMGLFVVGAGMVWLLGRRKPEVAVQG
jgi:Na+/melibiose symporter-like transporter